MTGLAVAESASVRLEVIPDNPLGGAVSIGFARRVIVPPNARNPLCTNGSACIG